MSVSISFRIPESQALSVLGLTYRAQRIVRFPHKVLIQPLEYELGHSLKKGRAGLVRWFYMETEFSGN